MNETILLSLYILLVFIAGYFFGWLTQYKNYKTLKQDLIKNSFKQKDEENDGN